MSDLPPRLASLQRRSRIPSSKPRKTFNWLKPLVSLPLIAGLYAAFGLLYVATFLAVGADVALNISYGVGLVALVLAVAMYLVRSWLADASPPEQRAVMTGRRWKHSLAVLIIPIAISWLDNETLYGALSPRDYWLDQGRRNSETCVVLESLALSQADSVRVDMNKFNMGIATRSEVQDGFAVFNHTRQMLVDCRTEAAARKAHIESKLQKLTPQFNLFPN